MAFPTYPVPSLTPSPSPLCTHGSLADLEQLVHRLSWAGGYRGPW